MALQPDHADVTVPGFEGETSALLHLAACALLFGEVALGFLDVEQLMHAESEDHAEDQCEFQSLEKPFVHRRLP
jgi:hypothetical protein